MFGKGLLDFEPKQII